MNSKSTGLIVFIIFGMFSSTFAWAEEVSVSVSVCGKDIADPNHPFHWDKLSFHVPDDLAPNNKIPIFKNFNKLYLKRLENNNESLTKAQNKFIAAFKKLQEDIIKNKKTANVSINLGLDGFGLNSGAKLIYGNVPCNDIDLPYFRDIAYMVIAYQKVHASSWETLRDLASRRIAFLDNQYENWFNNGLPMWPQETYFNGLLLDESDAKEAKKWQLVVARPSMGFGFNTNDNMDMLDPEATLAIEPIGFVKYTSNDYSEYWGGSALLTFGDDVGTGYGILTRYNKYIIGLTKRSENPVAGVSSDDIYLFIGFDLYELFNNKNEKFKGFKEKVKANIVKFKN